MANDQEVGRLVLRLVAEVSDLKKGLQDIRKVVQDTSAQGKVSAKSFDDSIAGIKKSYLAATAAVYMAYQGIKKAFDFAEIGGKAEAVAESFEAITREVGANGAQLVASIKESAKVYIDETDLMLMSNKLLAEGIAATDIPKLFEAARVAARLMGTSVNEAMELITRAVLTFQTRGLFKQAFPMESERVFEQYAQTLKLDADMLSTFGKQQAMVNEILRQAAEKARILGGPGGMVTNNYENLQLLNSAWMETKELLGKIIVTAIMKTSDALGWMIDRFVSAYAKVEKFFVKVKDTAMAVTEFVGLTQKKPAAIPEIGLAAAHGTTEAEDRAFAVSHSVTTTVQNKKDLADYDKLQKALTKLRLDAEKARVDAAGQISMSSLEAEHERAVAMAKMTSDDTFLIDQEFQRRKAEMELDNTITSLKAQEAAEVAAAVSDKKTREIPAIRQKVIQAELVAYGKFNSEMEKIEAKSLEIRNEAYRKGMQARIGFTPEEFGPITTEDQLAIEERSIARTQERNKLEADHLNQLAEAIGDYNLITNAQTKSLEVERANFKQQADYNKLNTDAQQRYNDLMDMRIVKLKQARELESLRDIADWRKQIGELTGNWVMAKDAEIQALAVERDYLLSTKALTPAMREYVNELYNLKIAEVEARKSMDALGLSVIGFRKYVIQTKNDLADMWENALPNMMRSFWDEFENYLKTGKMSWKNFTESLKSQWIVSVRKTLEATFADLFQKGVSSLGKLLGVEVRGTAKPLTPQEKTNAALDATKGSTDQLKISNEQLRMVDEQLRTTNEALKTEVVALTTVIRELPASIRTQTSETTGKIAGVMTAEEIKKSWPEATTESTGGITGEMTQAEIAMAWPEAVQDGAKKSSASVDKMYGDMEKSGTSAIGSIINGLGDMGKAGVGAIASIAYAIINFFKGGSKGGAPSWAGLVIGIVNLLGGAYKSFSSTSSSTTPSPAYQEFERKGYQKGGSVQGSSGVDAVPIRATAGEFIHSVPAVQHYGESVMAAINARMVPRDVLRPYAYASTLRPSGGFQTGGMVTENAVSVGPINVNDPRLASHMRGAIEQTVIEVLKRFSR